MIHRMRRSALPTFLAAVTLFATALVPVQAAAAARSGYIVQVARGASAAVEARALALGGSIGFRYSHAIQGFSVTLPEAAAASLAATPGVLAIEADGTVTADTTQLSPTWGIDRIDQDALPLSNSYTYADKAGSGVRAYIIDTGIRATHTELGGRVNTSLGYDAVRDGNGTNDCAGHGTHVAGTVGGNTYGVAKAVTLIPIRVLDCNGSGTNSGVIAGIDFVTAAKQALPGTPMVANMSLGGGASSLLDAAVASAVTAGVVMAVAAGNSNANACNYSPARAASAITVGATTSGDARASYSNYGSCLDIFAPGSSITSSWNTSNTATNTISGTSMATPHVAGAVALFLGETPTASPATVVAALTSRATPNVVTSAGSGSPNRLLYSGFITNTIVTPPTVIPDTPTGFIATAGDARVSLSWNPAANAESYTVSVSPTRPGCTTVATSCVITGLTNGTAYTFTLVAHNRIGSSSAVQRTATPVAAPVLNTPSAPQNVQAVAGSRSLTASWSAPANNGGAAVASYTVELWRGSTNTSGSRIAFWTGRTTPSIGISGLSRGVQYYIRVAAVNSVGTGAYAPSNVILTY